MRNQQTPQPQYRDQEPRQRAEPIASERIECQEERKTFFLDIFENQRGRALRLKERSGKTSMVMIPLSQLREIGEICIRMADWSEKNK